MRVWLHLFKGGKGGLDYAFLPQPPHPGFTLWIREIIPELRGVLLTIGFDTTFCGGALNCCGNMFPFVINIFIFAGIL